jgi:DNA-binding GntR family transcriptional regulator
MNKVKSNTPSRLVIFVIDEFNKQMFGLPKDSRCPLEQDLANECGVSRTTVRKAYELLNKQGLVYRKGSVRFLKNKVKTNTVEQKSPPISREEEVSEYLIGLIGKGEIVNGQKLSENRIAEIIGCSISPVREAFISLAPLGIFEKQSRHQWQVVNPDKKMFQELYEFRRILETYCLKNLMQEAVLAKKTPKLKTLLKKTESLLEKDKIDFKRFFEIDVSLHLFLLEVPGNRFIMERSKFIYTIIDFQRSSRFYSMDRARLALNQHVDILKAIISSNEQTALSELEKHLSSSLETLKNINKAEAG